MSAPVPQKSAALRQKTPRNYLIGTGLAMMADNIEHVITYWVLWEMFHSELLVGFEVVSHWLPFLMLSVPFGALAERVDCRKIIQFSQVLFMLVSLSWGLLFLTDSLQMWSACVLLVLHGIAGAMWAPAEQMLLHDFVEERDLPGAIRLNATFRSLGILCGPVVGSVLLFGLGPVWGIFANIVFYLPLTLMLMRVKQTGHASTQGLNVKRPGFRAMFATLGSVARDRTLFGIILLSGLAAVAIGGSLQVSIPDFATSNLAIGDGGIGYGGIGYGVLLFANGAGGVIGGFLIEALTRGRPTPRAIVCWSLVFGVTTVAVALTHTYWLALLALVIGGVANLVSNSMGQALAQLRAAPEERGRVIGVYGMFSSGFRVGNGVTLAVLGTLWGIGPAVALGGAFMVVAALVMGWFMRANREAAEA
ncbi:MAG: MFS transporter [Galactobacter sp.]